MAASLALAVSPATALAKAPRAVHPHPPAKPPAALAHAAGHKIG